VNQEKRNLHEENCCRGQQENLSRSANGLFPTGVVVIPGGGIAVSQWTGKIDQRREVGPNIERCRSSP
jgi:hypothetical protein